MIKIKRVQNEELSKFIKRLLSIDSSIYLRLENGKITSNVYMPDRDVVKTQSIDITEVFVIDEESYAPYKDKCVKIAFFQGNKFIDMMSQFDGAFSAEISLVENVDGITATSFRMFDNDELEIDLICSDPALTFEDIPQDKLDIIFDKTEYVCKFSLTNEDKSSVKSLLGLEKDSETFEMVCDDVGVKVKGAQVKRKLHTSDLESNSSSKIILSKRYFNFLDNEDYQVYVSDRKVTFESLESSSMITVSVLQDN